MSSLPTGTVTFFFSDIEGSTRLIQQLGVRYPDVLLAHHTIQREALAANGGHELRTEGDSFFIVFGSALEACAGAAAVQRSLQAHAWPDGGQVRVRIGLHTGEATLVGRDDQVREAQRLLKRSRLLTLTGPGGTGKTRLSLQIAAGVLDQFPDGVYFVPLSAIHDPDLVPSAIARALAISTTGSRRPIEALLDNLREKQTLLVLDNFEQVLEAATVATQLLEGSAGLRVLVSSRIALRASGEQEFPVPPLALPDLKALPGLAALSQFEAVRLFIERAVAVKPDFQATNVNAIAIAGICERVDGPPLAIELAAVPVKLFSPQALLGRLDTSLNVLAGGSRDLPGRQQTLRGAIAWSYDLLDEPQRRLFARF